MRIKSFRSISQSKGEFSARKILTKISRKESFDISQYFKATEKKELRLPKVATLPLKIKAKEYYELWEIQESSNYKRSFRSRHREVIDKIKMKQVLVPSLNFKLSEGLRKRITHMGSVKIINTKFV